MDTKDASLRALAPPNFVRTDVQSGEGPYVTVLLKSRLGCNPSQISPAQAALATAQGTDAFLSNSVGGAVAKHAGHTAGFLTLAGIAAAGLIHFWVFMPETKERGKKEHGKKKEDSL